MRCYYVYIMASPGGVLCTGLTNDLSREKQIKGWVRRKKTALIAEANPQWADLAADWYGPAEER